MAWSPKFDYTHHGFEVGRYYPLRSDMGAGRGLPSMKVPAVIIHDHQFAVAAIGMTLCVRDLFVTSPGVVATLEFLIGGRVGVNEGTSIEIVNERSVVDGHVSFARMVKKTASLWVTGIGEVKQPIEIQTNGGVMGIKG
jgi:hypothetical protein